MNATLEAPSISRVARRQRSGVGPWALARTEGGRLLRHPIMWFGVALSIFTFVLASWESAPVLQRDDILTTMGLLPLAGATLLTVNLALTRSRRHGTDELYGSVPVGEQSRTVAHLLSLLWAMGVGAVLVVAMIGYRLVQHPVGRPNWVELATGPAIVGLAGAIGVAGGRWWTQAASGSVLLVALAGTQIILQVQLSGGVGAGRPARWLAPWVPLAVSGDPARELVVRPAAWHLLYLVGLGAAISAGALLRSTRGLRPAALMAGGLAIVVVAGAIEIHGPTSAQVQRMADLLRHPERHQVCVTRSSIRYCAFPPYAGWTDRWAGSIEPILALVPADARPRGVQIIQTLVLYGSDVELTNLPPATTGGQVGDPGTDDLGAPIRPTSEWGQGAKEGTYQLGVDVVVAAMAVGLPRRPQDMPLTFADIRRITRHMQPADRKDFLASNRVGDPIPECSALGQARAVVALWLAASATDGTEEAFREDVESRLHHQEGLGPYFGAMPETTIPVLNFPVQWGLPEAIFARELLALPKDRVAQTVRAAWGHLTDPATPSTEIARLFGLRVQPSLLQEEQISDVFACR